MISSLAKSIALASLFVSPTSLAFTTLPSQGAASARHISKSLLHASAGEESNSRPQRPSLDAASQQEQQLNSNDIELPFNTPRNAPLPTNDISLNNNEPRSSEFDNLEPLSSSEARLSRLDSEARSNSIYISSGSDSYWNLRDEISQLTEDLASANLEVGVTSDSVKDDIQQQLRSLRAKDPEHVYKVIGGAARSAERLGNLEESEKYWEESLRARRMLPQFNLEGLWVGKYGDHGFEMINVTYSGDQLIAYKVTGDKNIPRGEISFTADLSPHTSDTESQLPNQFKLDPIILSESSAKKWGTKRLPRFPGHGHAAEPGYINHQFLEGQLVVIGEGDYFSFAWVPLEHQIFFGRPSPELTLKMLREGGGSTLTAGVGLEVPGLDAGQKEQTEYVARCLEVTEDSFWDDLNEGKVDPFSCIWHGDDAEYCYFE
mmetsp:Transcript_43205/g.78958  ORF Transcript_43205/g.78958 Transcript_43205/m.78958 type:complete len:432 (+) Transcript_43205:164-1459(+)